MFREVWSEGEIGKRPKSECCLMRESYCSHLRFTFPGKLEIWREEEDLIYRKSYLYKQEGIISEDKLHVFYLFIYSILFLHMICTNSFVTLKHWKRYSSYNSDIIKHPIIELLRISGNNPVTNTKPIARLNQRLIFWFSCSNSLFKSPDKTSLGLGMNIGDKMKFYWLKLPDAQK